MLDSGAVAGTGRADGRARFEQARYQFSPVTSDSGGENPNLKQQESLRYVTSETPCATEDSNPTDVDTIDFLQNTPKKMSRGKSQHVTRANPGAREKQNTYF